MEEVKNYFRLVRKGLRGVSRRSIANVVTVLKVVKRKRGTVFLCGNGGSGSTASHLVGDLCQLVGVRAVCLNDSMSNVSANANDDCWGNVFVNQLRLFLRPFDVVWVFSGSGNSLNVVNAVEFANRRGNISIGFCGFDGGRLKKTAMFVVHVPVDHMGVCEDVHLLLGHLVCYYLEGWYASSG